MSEIEKFIPLADAVTTYGILVVIAVIFLVVCGFLIIHIFKQDKIRTQREDTRYNQLVDLTKMTAEIASRGNIALENNAKVMESVQGIAETAGASVADTNTAINAICADIKDHRHLTDKMFTELRVMHTRLNKED